MAKRKIFISSVQAEFVHERKALHDYICADPLLGKFFEPFLFELLPAIDQRVDIIYLKEVEQSDIYLAFLVKNMAPKIQRVFHLLNWSLIMPLNFSKHVLFF